LEFGRLENGLYFLLGFAALGITLFGIKRRAIIIKALHLSWKENSRLGRKIFGLAGIFLMLFGLLEPRILKGTIPVERRGLDIFFLIDVSKSMLSDDIKPNRLERSRETIRTILEVLKGDRVGFIPFSGEAYIQMPLTEDYDMAQLFLESIDTEMISGGGSNIAEAIKLSANAFHKDNLGEKVIILMSDGEEHDQRALDLAKTLSGVRIYTVGLGTPKGALVPDIDIQGQISGYKKDAQGNYIISRLHEETLMALADTLQGKYFLATTAGEEAARLVSELSYLKRVQLREDHIKDYRQLYQLFLGLGMLLFILSYLEKETWIFFRRQTK